MRDRRTMPAIPPTSQPIPPPAMVAPSLLDLLPGVYDPHEADGTSPTEVQNEITDRHEAVTKLVPLQPVGAAGPLAPVYTMTKEWQAIDVSINVPASVLFGVTAGNAIGIQVFSLIGSTRALVASGRYGIGDFNAGTLQKRLVAFRGGAERYDIQLSCNFLSNPGDIAQVTMFGADVESSFDDDQNIGIMSLSANDLLLSGANAFSVSADAPLELVAVAGVNVNAATRYLHIHDKPAGTNVAGLAPIHCFALGPGAGAVSGIESFERIVRVRRFQKGILLACSTTPFTTTLGAAGDMGFQAWYR